MQAKKSNLFSVLLNTIVGLVLVSLVNVSFAAELKLPFQEEQKSARKFLPPEQAFGLIVKQSNSQASSLHFEIAPGYYIYKQKIGVNPLNKKIELLSLQLPLGELKEDEFFGESEIYRKSLAFSPTFSNSSPEDTFEAEISYQGCAENGICYPPTKRMVLLKTSSNSVAQMEKSSSITQRIVTQLHQKSFFYVLFAFFVFGLLLSFTPCVLPMIPILSGIIVGRTHSGEDSKALPLSIFYVLGMASMYSLIGVAAGFLGYSFHLSFQKPLVVILFSLVFVILACSMFGLFRLQVPSFISRRLDAASRKQTSGTYFGVFMMGLISALIAGPCLAPPLAAAMTFISQTGSPITGGAVLFVMGLGMGVPLIAIGASAGYILPRVGGWMERINQLFGFIFISVAIVFLERVAHSSILFSLWFLLLLAFLIWFGLIIHKTSLMSRRPQLKWLVMSCYVMICGFSLYFYLNGSPSLTSSSDLAESERNQVRYLSVSELTQLQAAIDASVDSDQIVILDVYADWCVECRHLEKKTFEQPLVRTWLNENQLLRFDVTDNNQMDRKFLSQFTLYGPPAVLFFKDGKEVSESRIIGFVDANEFLEIIKQVERSEN